MQIIASGTDTDTDADTDTDTDTDGTIDAGLLTRIRLNGGRGSASPDQRGQQKRPGGQ